MFGLKEAEVATLVRAVTRDDLDRSAIRERFAMATWTGIAEPGDRMAGLVVEAMGAADSLEAIVARWPAVRWSAALRHAGVDEIPDGDIDQAIERWRPRLKSEMALLALRQAARYATRLLTPGDEGWPAGVADLGLHRPIGLWVRGTDATLAALDKSISLVGARAATGYGEHITMEATAGLVDRGYAIVSGAAYGIDGVAHRTAIASNGQTVAFLAGGVDRYYPSGHEALLTRIVEVGAVISELPCGAPPTKWRFLQRNRLIAAASQGTVVLEAGWRSGSLNTAGHAAQLGRPLGAVPGPVTSAASEGCHRLIREFGAELVTSSDQMVELITGTTPGASAAGADETRAEQIERSRSKPNVAKFEPSADETRLLDALSLRAPRRVSDLAARAGMAESTVKALLGGLGVAGVASEAESGWLKRAAT
jgi:DNA processing protein